MRKLLLIPLLFLVLSCSGQEPEIRTGAEQMERILPLLKGKNIAIVANHTSMVGKIHFVDTLNTLAEDHLLIHHKVLKVFVPEHGFRGDFDAGAVVADDTDPHTGIPVVSLYGKHKKPTDEDMHGIDLVLFDIQDVGVRFYTYISTLHYVMEACAEYGISLVVLDRPNPNANYIDGPVLDTAYSSFVGMHPIPVVYGMTIGELARMINGEGWLEDGIQCRLTVIPCENYMYQTEYELPVKPSPNLTNHHAIRLYPSTCFFEGTVISEGRGTEMPFEIYGHPDLPGEFTFIPRSIEGMSKHPKLEGKLCRGRDLREYTPEEGWTCLQLGFLMDAYDDFPDKDNFFIPYFNQLAGNSILMDQIKSGMSKEAIRDSWMADIEAFMIIREKYLLYE